MGRQAGTSDRYNTAGAIPGALPESFSQAIGFQYVIAIAGLLYLASGALHVNRHRQARQHERLLTY